MHDLIKICKNKDDTKFLGFVGIGMKYLFLSLSYTLTFQTKAMEKETTIFKKIVTYFTVQPKNKPTSFHNNPSPLLQLHSNLQDIITQYLIFNDRETDQEFINRSKAITYGTNQQIPIEYPKDQMLQLRTKFFLSLFADKKVLKITNKTTQLSKELYLYDQPVAWHDSTLFSCSPNHSKVILSKIDTRYSPYTSQSLVMIIDLNTKKEWRNYYTLPPLYAPCIHMSNADIYHAIAVANCGNIFARVYQSQTNPIGHYVEIKNCIATKYPQIHEHPVLLPSIKSMTFNKQGTKLIVHNEDDEYIIIPISTQEEHETKSIKKLADYLQHQGVCKNLLVLKDERLGIISDS